MTTPPLPFPLIVLEGSPTERGIAYGRGCRDRVQATIDVYRRIFKTEGKLTWSRALDAAAGYAEPIERYDPDIRAEITGIAQGAAVPEKAILAINARSELLFQLTAGTAAPKPCCTALAALAPPDSDGAVLMAQNWDWYRATMDQCVLLLIQQPPRPTILQLVEAGLIAKMGLNSAGIGLCTNALLTDGWRVGVPYHAILRGILNARHMGDAIGAVTRARRASAGNFLIGHGDGFAVDIEASPDHLNLLYPQQGVLTHANHFQRSNPANADLMARLWPDTVVRDVRAAQLCRAQRRGDDLTWIKRVLSDHFDHPSGICTHPGDTADPDAQWQTNASMIMDLGRRMMFLTHGPPCRNEYRPVDAGAMFDRDSSSPVEGELP